MPPYDENGVAYPRSVRVRQLPSREIDKMGRKLRTRGSVLKDLREDETSKLMTTFIIELCIHHIKISNQIFFHILVDSTNAWTTDPEMRASG
jgi:hypothetical protein